CCQYKRGRDLFEIETVRPRGDRARDPPSTVASRPCAALATTCKRSLPARERRKRARPRARSSVECASHGGSYEASGASLSKMLTDLNGAVRGAQLRSWDEVHCPDPGA